MFRKKAARSTSILIIFTFLFILLMATLLSATTFITQGAGAWTPTPKPTVGVWTATPTPWGTPSDNPSPTNTPSWNPTATSQWQPSPTNQWQPTATTQWQPSPTSSPTPWPSPTPTATPLPVPQISEQTDAPLPYTIVSFTDRVAVANPKNLGINIGARDQFGAAQILKNVIPNPGFESAEFSTIFLAHWSATGTRIQADNWDLDWNNNPLLVGHPVGFWNGAEFEILTGRAAGRIGQIEKFTHEDGRPTYYFSDRGSAPQNGDVIIVRHTKPGYFQKRPNGYNFPDTTTTRPGSPGTQSLRLQPSARYAASHIVPLDSLARDGDPSAGKLFLINGQWKLELWAKAANPGDKLRVQFRRIGESTFYDETIWLSTEWRKIERTFTVPSYLDRPTNSPGPVVLEMRIPPGGQHVWIDDASLYEANQTNPTVFTDNFVNRLNDLQPGIIRDWGEQLGSTLDNQLASEFARKTTGYSPLTPNPVNWHYSLHEFLQLAQHIKSEPWYVIPPTLKANELQNLMAYLSAPVGSHPYADLRADLGQPTPWTSVFPIIHLEFGNEMWGSNAGDDQFIGATVRGGERLGQVAGQRFGIMKASQYYREYDFNLIIGGQVNDPRRQSEIEANSSQHDTIALAPYYGDLTNYATNAQRFYPLFAEPMQNVTFGRLAQSQRNINNFRRGTQTAIYEVNMHTTFGNVPIDVRNDFVTGTANGIALPLTMLTYLRDLNIRNQAAFTAAQYSFRLSDGSGFARLWGLIRDLESTGRVRPAWMGLELANLAIRGNMMHTEQTGKNPSYNQPPMNNIFGQVEVPYIQSFAFEQWNRDYALVLFNVNINRTETVRIELPDGIDRTEATIYTLKSPNIHADNEISNQVFIQEQSTTIWNNYELFVPPHTMVVIEFGR